MPEPRSLRAALLDRDGTIIPDREYTRHPDDVSLLPGAASAIGRLRAAGYPSIAITNQSGIARGLITLAAYRAVRRRLDDLLRAEGEELADTFTCPHHPEITGACECRKPASGLYERAAAVHNLDLSRCFFIGDKARDIQPAQRFGARAVLIRSGYTAADDLAVAASLGVPVTNSLDEAVSLLLGPGA